MASGGDTTDDTAAERDELENNILAAGAISVALMSDRTMPVHVVVDEHGVVTGELDVMVDYAPLGHRWKRLSISLSPDQHEEPT